MEGVCTWWFIPLSKWVITPVISGLTLLIPFITGVITHLLSGMNHQVGLLFLSQISSHSNVSELWDVFHVSLRLKWPTKPAGDSDTHQWVEYGRNDPCYESNVSNSIHPSSNVSSWNQDGSPPAKHGSRPQPTECLLDPQFFSFRKNGGSKILIIIVI